MIEFSRSAEDSVYIIVLCSQDNKLKSASSVYVARNIIILIQGCTRKMGCNTSKDALKAVEAAAGGADGGGASGDADDNKTVAEQEIEDEEYFPGK